MIERRDFMHAANDINAKRIDNLFLITRGNIIPAVAKLTHEQAAAFMVLGQSMESSAGDPTQAGTIKNEFFYDPFIAGDRCRARQPVLRHPPGQRPHQLLPAQHGLGGRRRVLQGHHAGRHDGHPRFALPRRGRRLASSRRKTGLVIPRSIRAVDSILMRPEKLFPAADFEARQRALDRQRAEYMDNYPGLDPQIKAVFQTRLADLVQVA